MFHDQFDVHLKDDIDRMVVEAIDQDDNHEVYQAKTYLHRSLAFRCSNCGICTTRDRVVINIEDRLNIDTYNPDNED